LLSVEGLEPRSLFSVSINVAGSTIVTPSDDTRTIYVSSSTGSDDNSGASPQHAVKSLAHAMSMLRDGKPDHVLVKRGDRFVGGFGQITVSGPDADDPIYIGTYGKGSRPLINTGTNEGLFTAGGSGFSVDNVVIEGLHFVAGGYNGTNGGYQTCAIDLMGRADDWIVEDCSVEGYKDNISLDAQAGSGVSNFTLRRCEILDSYVASPTVGNGHSQGMYVSGTSSNITIDQNIFDHNGWNANVAGAEPTFFNHAIYVNTGAQGVVITNNIITRSSLRGVLLRSGGVVENNLLYDNPVGIQVGNTASRVIGNVILAGNSQPGIESGIGIDVIALPGAKISSNIIAHQAGTNTVGAAGIDLETGTKSATVNSNIIYDWSNAVLNNATRDVTIMSNELQDDGAGNSILINQQRAADLDLYDYANNVYSTDHDDVAKLVGSSESFNDWANDSGEANPSLAKIGYVAPNRSVASYNASVGGKRATMAWINAIRSQSEATWNKRYTAAPMINYIRAGFAHVAKK
jgi:hypothetical protein